MSPPRHRPTVNHRNRFGARMWWAECACGWYQGWHDKRDAQRSAAEHRATAEVSR